MFVCVMSACVTILYLCAPVCVYVSSFCVSVYMSVYRCLCALCAHVCSMYVYPCMYDAYVYTVDQSFSFSHYPDSSVLLMECSPSPSVCSARSCQSLPFCPH